MEMTESVTRLNRDAKNERQNGFHLNLWRIAGSLSSIIQIAGKRHKSIFQGKTNNIKLALARDNLFMREKTHRDFVRVLYKAGRI